ncbi:MAG: xylose isomerase [Defluviitaleaceae bacterium]|nr:xylose isomerase [Defluviitaleaceae bacterium]
MSEYFKGIGNISYEGSKSDNPLSYKYYNPEEVVAGKTMRDHFKFGLSYWHTLCAEGVDMFGEGTADKSFGAACAMDHAKHKVHACFELLGKMDIDYFCFHDRDVAPEGATLAESNKNLDIIVDEIEGAMKQSGKKLLWGTANLFSNKRFVHGAGTAPNADVFAYAAAQIKKALEVTVRLGGTGYTFWGGREGYETLLNTKMGFELDNMARLMHMAVEYGRKIGFTGDFYIEPKPKEPMKHQYDFDAATAHAFLQKYGLMGDFKLNIEANHATLAGHSFQHELMYARENGLLGSIDANTGDLLLGWDTDQFPTSIYEAAFCMLEVLKAGGFTTGGLNFDAKARRGSFDPEDIFLSYISGIDAYALGLKIAAKIIEDGRIDKFVEDRYASYKTGIGADIVSGKVGFVELEKYAIEMGEVATNKSGRQEYLESLLNQIIIG